VQSAPPKILISEAVGFPADAAEELGAVGNLVMGDLDRQALLSAVADADVLWVRLRHLIDQEVLTQAPRLQTIVTATTGLNHIDLQAVKRRDIQLLSLCGEAEFLRDIRATAELTVALVLALCRKLAPAIEHVRAGGWNRDLFKGRELHRKTVGIIGYGRLGRIVARYFRALDMRVLATDPAVGSGSTDADVQLVSLPTLLREADVVTLHVNLNDQTRQFFRRKHFAAMKKGAYFINTARGELIEENALLSALESGHLEGAALDVLTGECSSGMTDHPLVAYAQQHVNLIITPHIGGCTTESIEKTERFLARKLRSALISVRQKDRSGRASQ
jgi:D-3-phosphoglycerate dehydrogenase